MITRACIGTLLLVVGVGASQRLAACGDKYLNLGPGTHYRRSAAERRGAATILVREPGHRAVRLVTTLQIEDAMKKVGYQPVISLEHGLDAALRTPKLDVIVVDGRDMPNVMQRLQKTAAPHVVPVLTRPTKDRLKQAEKDLRHRHQHALQEPGVRGRRR